MNKYRVFVRGENFHIGTDEPDGWLGFYTTRYVEAQSAEDAENVAMELLRKDPKLAGRVRNEASDPPMMYAEEVDEIASFDGCPVPGTGFTFYPMGTEE